MIYAITTAGTNTYTASIPGLTTYAGLELQLAVANTNTDEATLQIDALTEVAIEKRVNGVKTALAPGDLDPNKNYYVVFDGVSFVIEVASIEQALYYLLSTNATITALVGYKIYNLKMPDTEKLPGIVFTFISDDPTEAFGIDDSLTYATYQISTYTNLNTNDADRQRNNINKAIMGAIRDFSSSYVLGINIQSIKFTGSRASGTDQQNKEMYAHSEYVIAYDDIW